MFLNTYFYTFLHQGSPCGVYFEPAVQDADDT